MQCRNRPYEKLLIDEKGYLQSETSLLYSCFCTNGGIAQLGERLHGMQEVSGSIPLTSTNSAEVRQQTVEVKM